VLRSGHQRAAANSSCDRLDLGCREARAWAACSPGGLRAWSGRQAVTDGTQLYHLMAELSHSGLSSGMPWVVGRGHQGCREEWAGVNGRAKVCLNSRNQ
jgi:hypothetical protein